MIQTSKATAPNRVWVYKMHYTIWRLYIFIIITEWRVIIVLPYKPVDVKKKDGDIKAILLLRSLEVVYIHHQSGRQLLDVGIPLIGLYLRQSYYLC